MATTTTHAIDKAAAMVLTPPPFADYLIVAPLVLGFLFGSISLMMRKDTRLQPVIGIFGLGAMLAADIGLFWHVFANGTVVMTMGQWLPPFGITFAADMLSATFALVAGVVGFAGGIYAISDIDDTGRRYGFYPFLLLMMAGVTTAFITGDLFNLYVWFEVLLIGSFGLLILGSGNRQLDGGTKYAFLNLVATTLFLIATAYLYGVFGTLNMADIARTAPDLAGTGPRLTIALLFFFAFAMKAAAFPMNFWLPASYHTPRIVVSAVFAGLLTKVGVYALFRIFLTLLPNEGAQLSLLFAAVAAVTIIVGALGALAQNDIRRMMGYVVISGIGNMLAGLALASQTGVSGGVLYAAHSMVVMTALYLLAGIMARQMGTYSMREAGGLYAKAPALAVLCFVLIFAASGLPPFSGLWPKILLVKASLDVGAWWLATAILAGGLLTTIALVRMFGFAFWREKDAEEADDGTILPAKTPKMTAASAGLALLAVIAGVYPEPFIAVTDRVAFELLHPQGYIDAVFPTTEAVPVADHSNGSEAQ